MPRMDTPDESSGLAKLLLIGDGKVGGKTHYAGMAADAGFNVLYLDGDVGRPTIRNLPIEARRRIYALDVADTMGNGRRDHRFVDIHSDFTQEIVFKWNDTEQRVWKKSDVGECWEIRPARMDHTCVLVIDSWTALTESMLTWAAKNHGVDLTDTSTAEMRNVYQTAGHQHIAALQCIRSARCHVIVLAHPDEYSHTTKPKNRVLGGIKETELIVDWTKMIPKSTSKPQSLLMAKYFTDVAWAEVSGSGSQRLLNFRLDEGKISGGHFTDRKDSEKEYSFANLVRHIGGSIPESTPDHSHWLNIIPALTEEEIAERAAATPLKQEPKVLDGTAKTTIESPTMKSLFAKK